MFLHMSVILFTGGEGVVSQHALQVVSQHALQQVSGGGYWYPSMPCRFPSPHPREKLRSLACGGRGGGSPGPHPGGSPGPHPGGSPGPHLGWVSGPGGSPGFHLGGVSQHALRQTPRWLLLWVVRILLERILVLIFKI